MLTRIKAAYQSGRDWYARYQRARDLRSAMLFPDKKLREEYIKLDADLKGKSGVVAHSLVAGFLWGGASGTKQKDSLAEGLGKVRPYGDDLASRQWSEPTEEKKILLGKKPDRPEGWRSSGEYRTASSFPDTNVDGNVGEPSRSIPPKSALYRPPRLTQGEKKAVELVETMKKHIDGVEVKLKPALAKKKRETDKGPRRVIFNDKGKMKEVKKGA